MSSLRAVSSVPSDYLIVTSTGQVYEDVERMQRDAEREIQRLLVTGAKLLDNTGADGKSKIRTRGDLFDALREAQKVQKDVTTGGG